MIFATANKHKLREMRELLPERELKALPDGVELPPEEGESFAVIALIAPTISTVGASFRGATRASSSSSDGATVIVASSIQ